MINLEDGSVLSGDECPKKKDLDEWMQQHPGCMIDNSICLLDPYLLEMQASLAAGNMAGVSNSGGPASLGRAGAPPTPTNSSTSGRGEDEDANQQVVLHTPEIGPVRWVIHFVFSFFFLISNYLFCFSFMTTILGGSWVSYCVYLYICSFYSAYE